VILVFSRCSNCADNRLRTFRLNEFYGGIATARTAKPALQMSEIMSLVNDQKRLLLSAAEDSGCAYAKSPPKRTPGRCGRLEDNDCARCAREPSLLFAQTQDVGDQIVHIGWFDHKVWHGRMACARPHRQRCH
jgi:hypothetical protein